MSASNEEAETVEIPRSQLKAWLQEIRDLKRELSKASPQSALAAANVAESGYPQPARR